MTNPDYNIFKQITNKDIYKILIEVRALARKTNGIVKYHDRWLIGLSIVMLTLAGWIILIQMGI